MSLIEEITARISANVPALTGRIEGIADLAALIDSGGMPSHDTMAFVVPLGFDDRGGDSASGAHTQMLQDSIGVVLCVKASGDVKARRALPKIDSLIVAVRDLIAGWAPDDVAGAFTVTKGRMVSAQRGLVIYQIDFAVLDQLRIIR